MRYYDFKRHWTMKVEPHLGDPELNRVLVRDFNKFTYGRWRRRFGPGMYPDEFESCDWRWSHRSPQPRYWRYVVAAERASGRPDSLSESMLRKVSKIPLVY
jgi:hypothetical protein